MLDLAAMLVFAGALFVAAASPGPGIAAIVARVLGRGAHGALAFTMGVAIGDVVWLTFAVAGLAVLAQTFSVVFVVVKYVGAAYLLYLAFKLWTAPVAERDLSVKPAAESSLKLFLGGLAVTMGNPKVMVFYLALLPNLLDLAALTVFGYLELVAIVVIVLTVVFGGYVLLAHRARALFTSVRAQRAVNRTTGGVMAGAAVWVAVR